MWRATKLLSLLASFLSLKFTLISAAATTTDAAPNPASTACGDIVRNDERIFLASDVKACLLSVPFNPAVATQFLKYYRDTLQFQSTLGYLKNPPTGYQQPAVDLIRGLDNIQIGINNGAYRNQFDFEVSLQKLIFSAHDDHLTLINGILGAFTFGAPIDIVSVSLDGIALPKPYILDHLIEFQDNPALTISPIATLNDRPAVDYIKAFGALNSLGALESHTEYNLLMTSPASEIQNLLSPWNGNANFYPPDDWLKVTLEDGTKATIQINETLTIDSLPFIARYNGPLETGPLETGGDFYNFFVLGLFPDSYQPYGDWNPLPSASSSSESVAAATSIETPSTESSATSDSTSTASADDVAEPTGWEHAAYPIPDIEQQDLGSFSAGFVSGYFFPESSIAVLSIPSFKAQDEGVMAFSNAVGEFLEKSKSAGMEKVVIDLQQNFGGVTLLAYDTFKQFFPSIEPHGGSRLRAQESANVIGGAITKYFETLNKTKEEYYTLLADEWVSSNRINADTNELFVSWAEEFGPHQSNGDTFTIDQRFNLSDTLFNTLSVGNPEEVFTVYGYGTRVASVAQPYAAEDIIILSDSICASACSIFMEMMHHEAGVRTVVAGGLPQNGPMQAPGLTRGARYYDVQVLDQKIEFAKTVLEHFDEDIPNFIGNRTIASPIISAGINLRDQVRKGEEIPLQFLYEAADCRIFYTPQTVYNYTALWHYAAEAIWEDTSKCVLHSTGYSTINGTKTAAPAQDLLPPATSGPPPHLGADIMAVISDDSLKPEPVSSQSEKKTPPIEGQECIFGSNSTGNCPKDYYCLEKYTKCNSKKSYTVSACVPLCDPALTIPKCPVEGLACLPLPSATPGVEDSATQVEKRRATSTGTKRSRPTSTKRPTKTSSKRPAATNGNKQSGKTTLQGYCIPAKPNCKQSGGTVSSDSQEMDPPEKKV